MASSDPRASALYAFDGFVREFFHACVERDAAGGFLAAGDVDRLALLANRVAADLRIWSLAVSGLDLAAETPLALEPAGRLVLETVFDKALRPEALRVLAAALDLAWVGA